MSSQETIYTITDEYKALGAIIAAGEGEVTDEQIEALNKLDDKLDAKLERMQEYRENLDSMALTLKYEATRLMARSKQKTKESENLKELMRIKLKELFDDCGKTKVETLKWPISLRKKVVTEYSETEIPDMYKLATVKAEVYKFTRSLLVGAKISVDKTGIRHVLKIEGSDSIPGVTQRDDFSLIIGKKKFNEDEDIN